MRAERDDTAKSANLYRTPCGFFYRIIYPKLRIGKYERGENILSIDVAAKMAEALGVTLDYLVKDGEYEQIDNEMLRRLKEVQGAYIRHHRCVYQSSQVEKHCRTVDTKKPNPMKIGPYFNSPTAALLINIHKIESIHYNSFFNKTLSIHIYQ